MSNHLPAKLNRDQIMRMRQRGFGKEVKVRSSRDHYQGERWLSSLDSLNENIVFALADQCLAEDFLSRILANHLDLFADVL